MSYGNFAGPRTACPLCSDGMERYYCGEWAALFVALGGLPRSDEFPFVLFWLLLCFPSKTMCNHITTSCAGRSHACWRTGTASSKNHRIGGALDATARDTIDNNEIIYSNN